MPMRPENQQRFHRTLYAGWNQTVTLLKRGDDQQQGTVRKVILFNCRWGQISKTGEPIAGDESSNHRRTLHIPVVEMLRVGVSYINAADRFVDRDGRYWQPESTTNIQTKLGEVHWCVDCLRVDPPEAQ